MNRLLVLVAIAASIAIGAERAHHLAAPLIGKAWTADSDLEAERRRICTPGYAASIRPPVAETQHIKRQMARMWCEHFGDHDPGERAWIADKMGEGLSCVAAVMSTHELDHIIPLELDGAPLDPANLQLQPCAEWDEHHRCVAGPAYDKDLRENQAHRDYCASRITLDQARTQFKREYQ